MLVSLRSHCLREVLEQTPEGMVPLRLVLFEIVRDCREGGKEPGTACSRLLLSRWSWVRAARDEIDEGIEPESELEERSLSTDEISVYRPPEYLSPGHIQNKQGTLQTLTPRQTCNRIRQPLFPDNKALQR